MKTISLFFVAMFTFIVSINSQESPTFEVGSTYAITFSPNGDYVAIASSPTTNTGENGVTKVYKDNGSGTFMFNHEYSLTKGSGSTGFVAITGNEDVAVNNNGISHTYYYSNDTGVPYYTLTKEGYLIGENSESGMGLFTTDENLYISKAVGTSTTEFVLSKMDISANTVEWEQTFSGNNPEIIKSNTALYYKEAPDLIEISDTDGSYIGVAETGALEDRIQVCSDGEIQVYRKNINTLFFQDDYTDWGEVENFWYLNYGIQKWATFNGMTYALKSGFVFVLDSQLNHAMKYKLLSDTEGEIIISKIGDGFITYVLMQDGIPVIKHVDIPTLEVLTLNEDETGVEAIYNGQLFIDGTAEYISDYVATVILNDDDMVSIGDDITGTDYVNIPSYLTLNPGIPLIIKEDSYGLFTRYMTYFYHYGMLSYVNLKVYFKPLSSLSTTEEETIKFAVYPNPTNKILNIDFSQDIESITIRDSIGKTVFTKSYQSFTKSKKIDVTNLNPGHYFVSVQAKEGTNTRQLIIN